MSERIQPGKVLYGTLNSVSKDNRVTFVLCDSRKIETATAKTQGLARQLVELIFSNSVLKFQGTSYWSLDEYGRWQKNNFIIERFEVLDGGQDGAEQIAENANYFFCRNRKRLGGPRDGYEKVSL